MVSRTLFPVIFAAVCGASVSAAETERPPNIVYFFCDDLGYGDVSCYNPNGKIQTPHIDALAQSGMKFNDAHVASAMCTPSRYNLLTGRYCWRTPMKAGVNSAFSLPLITPERLTVANVLKKAGYTTGIVGKWHVGMDWPLKPGVTHKQPGFRYDAQADYDLFPDVDFSQPIKNGPCDLGFDTWFGISASSDMGPFTFIQDRQPVDTPTVLLPGGKDELRVRAWKTSKGWTHEAVLPTWTAKSQEFIAQHAKDTAPFFLYLPITAPHTPVLPTDEFKGKSKVGIYGDFMMQVDAAVGDVVKTLKDQGVWENTIFIFSSDNGPEYIVNPYPKKYGHSSTAGLRGIKTDSWEGGHRVPMIVSWPAKVKAGTTSDALVEIGDFMATMADLTNYKLPETAAEDSFSFLPILEGRADSVRTMAMHESNQGLLTYREGDWKLILHSGPGGNRAYNCPENKDPLQLFNMRTDRYEKKNVYREHPDVVKRLYGKAVKAISEGRTTPGATQSMGDLKNYRQYQQILKLKEKVPSLTSN